MKTTILLLVLIVGHVSPTYSQLNPNRKTDETRDHFQNKKNDDFGNYKFDNKFNDKWSDRTPDNFTMLPPARRTRSTSPQKIYSENKMPCVHPKSGDNMPCFKPEGIFPMRVFKPTNVIWGILW